MISEMLTPEDMVLLRGWGGRTVDDVEFDSEGRFVYMGDGKGGDKKHYF